jgi:hypothetical protein
VAIAVIVVVAIITIVVTIVVVIAVAVTFTIAATVVAGCCHCCQDNKFLTVLLCCMFFCNHKQVTVNDAYTTGQKVMGWANQRLGKLLPGSAEDLRFCGFFGVSAEVSVVAWDMIENHSVPPLLPSSFIFMGACFHAHISRK